MVSQNGEIDLDNDQTSMINRFYSDVQTPSSTTKILPPAKPTNEADYEFDSKNSDNSYEEHEEVEETLSLEDREKELIQKAGEWFAFFKSKWKTIFLELEIIYIYSI